MVIVSKAALSRLHQVEGIKCWISTNTIKIKKTKKGLIFEWVFCLKYAIKKWTKVKFFCQLFSWVLVFTDTFSLNVHFESLNLFSWFSMLDSNCGMIMLNFVYIVHNLKKVKYFFLSFFMNIFNKTFWLDVGKRL